MSAIQELPIQVRDALAAAELGPEDLTARKLGTFLGKTSSVLYHHFGSLDGFLFRVSQAGYELLGARVMTALDGGASMGDVAEAFVAFGLEMPGLYRLMFEWEYRWDALREDGMFEGELPGMTLWAALIGYMRGLGSLEPDLDARAFYAGPAWPGVVGAERARERGRVERQRSRRRDRGCAPARVSNGDQTCLKPT